MRYDHTYVEPQWAQLQREGLVRPSTLAEYVAWLKEYVKRGGTITHSYNYPWSRVEFLTALKRFNLEGECGSRARSIILPQTVGPMLCGAPGHNNVYVWNDVSVGGHIWVSIYSDKEFDEFRALCPPAFDVAKFRKLQHRHRPL